MLHKIKPIQWINSIWKDIHPPYTVNNGSHWNENTLIVWSFRGDGTGDFEQSSRDAAISGLTLYALSEIQQLKLLSEYIMTVSNDQIKEAYQASLIKLSDHYKEEENIDQSLTEFKDLLVKIGLEKTEANMCVMAIDTIIQMLDGQLASTLENFFKVLTVAIHRCKFTSSKSFQFVHVVFECMDTMEACRTKQPVWLNTLEIYNHITKEI